MATPAFDAMWKTFRSKPRTASAGKTRLSEFIKEEKQKFSYLYDLGDNWEHTVELEKILPKDIACPICITGKRACPPEDCGGVWGYEKFLEIIEGPNHPEHEERFEWIGGEFNPEHFDVKEIHFRELKTRNKHNRQIIGGTEPYKSKSINKRKIGRNDPCPCGSGLKYKKCCLKK